MQVSRKASYPPEFGENLTSRKGPLDSVGGEFWDNAFCGVSIPNLHQGQFQHRWFFEPPLPDHKLKFQRSVDERIAADCRFFRSFLLEIQRRMHKP